MNSNASPSQSPGPESSRRRSGRVVKAPQNFLADAAAAQYSAAKRKRGIDQEGDDVENEAPVASDEEMSDDQDDDASDDVDTENDDDHSPPSRRKTAKNKKASKPSRPRKPANKRVKTNGASTTIAGHPSSLPSRPKKTVRIERLPEDGTGLFGSSPQLILEAFLPLTNDLPFLVPHSFPLCTYCSGLWTRPGFD